MKLIPAGGSTQRLLLLQEASPPSPSPSPVDEAPRWGNVSLWEASPSPHFCPDGAEVLGKRSPQPGFLQHLSPRATRDLGSSLLQGIAGPKIRALACFLEHPSEPPQGF